jgi:3-methyladenine DNA glycosylase AlkD
MAQDSEISVGDVIERLESMSKPENREGMSRFGIKTEKAFGISMPELRKLAKDIDTDHGLALELWDTGYHEAQILAALIDDPRLVTEGQMDKWAAAFDSWDVCDQCCMNLFDKTQFSYGKALAWSRDDREFVRRAGFALMASLAIHDKKAPDTVFELFFPFIVLCSTDDRNYVKKSVNWALRQIGKRNAELNKKAIAASKEIQGLDSKTARWIAADALRELQNDTTRKKISKPQTVKYE